MDFIPCLFWRCGKEQMDLKEEALKAFYERYVPERTYEYLRTDPVYQEREKELKEAVAAFEPVIKALGRESWLKYDRILTAHNSCEAYALQAMYVRGAQDAIAVFESLVKEEKDGRN